MATNAIPNSPANGVFSTVGDLQAASWIRNGAVVSVRTSKLDYYIEETQDAGGLPITGTSPQLYANPQQTTPGTGETNTASNIGDGEGLFAQKVSSDLQFHSQVSQYGLESRLVGDTYYRGLNPFIADSIGALTGTMVTSRASNTAFFDKSGVITEAPVDLAAYGELGLSCFGQIKVKSLYSKDLNNAVWVKPVNWVFAAASESDPALPSVTAYDIDTQGNTGVLHQVFSSQQIKLNGGFRVKGVAGETIKVDVRASNSSVVQQVTHTFSGAWEFISCQTPSNTDWSVQTDATVRMSLRKDPPNTVTSFTVSMGICFEVSQTDISIDEYPMLATTGVEVTTAVESSVIPMRGNMPKLGGSFFFIVDTNFNDEFRVQTCIQIGSTINQRVRLRANPGFIVPIMGDGTAEIGGAAAGKSGKKRLVFRFDGSANEFQLFENGSPVGSPTVISGPAYNLNESIYIGNSDANNEPMNAYVKIVKWGVNQLPSNAKILEWGGYGDVI